MSRTTTIARLTTPRLLRLGGILALAACMAPTDADRNAARTAPAGVPVFQLGPNGGCAPLALASATASIDDGNVSGNAIDGSLTTRWSGLGRGAYITVDLGAVQTVCAAEIAWYNGNVRRNYFVVSVSADGSVFQPVSSDTSSGTTADFEPYAFPATSARFIRVTVNGNSINDWASILEMRVDGVATSGAPAAVSAVAANADDGNVPSNVLDGNFGTRWSTEGVGSYITLDLGASRAVTGVDVGWYQGTTRRNTFDVSVSGDGAAFRPAFSGMSSGVTNDVERYSFAPASARFVRVTVNGNTINQWASITELRARTQGTTSPYNDVVVADHPVVFLNVDASSGTEPDLTGRGHTGTFMGGVPTSFDTLPNGDRVAIFNGSTQYLTVPTSQEFSIPTTGDLTWEVWIAPSTLEQAIHDASGYVNFFGKCAVFAPSCEWEGRMYNTTTTQGRCNRLSAYAFNLSGGTGPGADWQPVCGLFHAHDWLHVVGEYTLHSQPESPCPDGAAYPGKLDIWVNGVKWNQLAHQPTGCMGQGGDAQDPHKYSAHPGVGNSPLNIGRVQTDTWFAGAIGKVAIYDHLLDSTQIKAHYKAMTGRDATGSCGNSCTFTP